MKKFLLLLFLLLSPLIMASNVYFLDGGSQYIHTNGQPFYTNQDGDALVSYWIWADPYRYTYDHCGASFQTPDGTWSDWSDLSVGRGYIIA